MKQAAQRNLAQILNSHQVRTSGVKLISSFKLSRLAIWHPIMDGVHLDHPLCKLKQNVGPNQYVVNP